jgi:adenine specific DNA methylase Mod
MIRLSLIKPFSSRLKFTLGVIFVQCDDNEQAYLKVLMDEIFGRGNFVNNVIWQKKFSPQNDAKWLSDNHDIITVSAKNPFVGNIFLPEGVIISYVSFSVTLLTVKSLEVQTPLVSLSKFL